jgi:REP element-mobilizing transposase RayT
MANTFTQLYAHIIFSPLGRHNLIDKKFGQEIYHYMAGIIKHKKMQPIRINGMPDHVHILLGFSPDEALSDIVRDIKSNSTGYIKKQRIIRNFEWQKGFGAFTYLKSLLPVVARYIDRQEIHHRKKTFREEYIELLIKAGIEFNEKYLFEWYE